MRLSRAFVWLAAACLSVPSTAAVTGQTVPGEAISAERIARLPAGERAKWSAYLVRSQALRQADKAALAAERSGRPAPVPQESRHSSGTGMPLGRPDSWYAGPEARRTADTIVSFQTPAGGWGKNVDRSGPKRLPGEDYVAIEHPPANAGSGIVADDASWAYVGTIDNGATTSELAFLGRVQAQLPGREGDPYRASLVKGIRYLLTAQFPNGGWPQVYPLQGGYHDALTFNDDAVAHVVTFLAAVAARKGDYAFIAEPLADEVGSSVKRAIRVILSSQVIVNGVRTVWGQQHDALTLKPVGARNFEPAALSTSESAGLLMLLMQQPSPSPEIRAAVTSGVVWLRDHAIRDREWTAGPGRRLVVRPGNGAIWARYYDLETMKPIFGDRDKSVHDDVAEISAERRDNYSWFGTVPAKVIPRYAKWLEQAR